MSDQKIDYDAMIAELRAKWGKGAVVAVDGKVCLVGAALRGQGCRLIDHTDLYSLPVDADDRAAELFAPIARAQFPDRASSADDYWAVANFNDHPDTTLDDVILVVEKARANQP